MAPKTYFLLKSTFKVNTLSDGFMFGESVLKEVCLKYLALCIQPPAAVHRLQNGATINNCAGL